MSGHNEGAVLLFCVLGVSTNYVTSGNEETEVDLLTSVLVFEDWVCMQFQFFSFSFSIKLTKAVNIQIQYLRTCFSKHARADRGQKK